MKLHANAAPQPEQGRQLAGRVVDGHWTLTQAAARRPAHTSFPVRSGSTKRYATAFGEGVMAVQLVHARVAERQQLQRIAAT